MDSSTFKQLIQSGKALKELNELEFVLARPEDLGASGVEYLILKMVTDEIIPNCRMSRKNYIRKTIESVSDSGDISLTWRYGQEIKVSWLKKKHHYGIYFNITVTDIADDEETIYMYKIRDNTDIVDFEIKGRDLY